MKNNIHKRIKSFIDKSITGIVVDDESYFTYSDVCLLIRLYNDNELIKDNDAQFNAPEKIDIDFISKAEDCYDNWYDKTTNKKIIPIEKKAVLYGFIGGYQDAKKAEIKQVDVIDMNSAYELQYCLECSLMAHCTQRIIDLKLK